MQSESNLTPISFVTNLALLNSTEIFAKIILKFN